MCLKLTIEEGIYVPESGLEKKPIKAKAASNMLTIAKDHGLQTISWKG